MRSTPLELTAKTVPTTPNPLKSIPKFLLLLAAKLKTLRLSVPGKNSPIFRGFLQRALFLPLRDFRFLPIALPKLTAAHAAPSDAVSAAEAARC